MAALGGVTHGDVGVDAVAVSTTGPFALHVAGFDQVGDDALGGSLGDSDALADITESRVRVAVEAENDLGVVREEPPGPVVVFRALHTTLVAYIPFRTKCVVSM